MRISGGTHWRFAWRSPRQVTAGRAPCSQNSGTTVLERFSFHDMIDIPFYPNLKDDTHCVQACLKSVLKFYFPKRNYSFRYLDRVTAHKRGKWTWDSAALMFLAQIGFEVIEIADFNTRKFAQKGEDFLRSVWPRDVFETQKNFLI